MGVISDFLPARKSSGTDWTCTFSVADRTYGCIGEVGQEGLKVRFFKKLQIELPQIWGTGDVVILRNMKMKEFNGMTLAISSYGSTWTIMHASSIPDAVPPNLVQLPHAKEPRAPAPAPSEMRYAIDVCNYFDKYSYTSKDAPVTVSADQVGNVNPTSNIVPRQKFSLIKDVQAAAYYDLVGQVVKVWPSNGRTDLYITDYTPNQLLYFYQWGQDEDGTGAREGDEYGYTSRTSKKIKKWPGPFGKLTLAVTLWPPHSEYAQQQVKEGDFVFLRNTHIRLDQDTKMVGSLHTDKRQSDRIDVNVLTNLHDDDLVKDVLRRKKDYHKKFDQQSEKYVIEARETKRNEAKEANCTETEEVNPLPRNLMKKKQRRENKKSHIAPSRTRNQSHAKRKHSNNSENDPTTSSRSTPASSPPPLKAPKFDSKIALNEYVKCSHHLIPISPLSTILSLDAHTVNTPKGTSYTLPFQNINTRASVRVVDFWPSRLQDFAVRKRKRSEYAILSDHEDSDSDRETKKDVLLSQNTETEEKEEKEWEWRFALLLEDASDSRSSREERPTLKAYLSGADAECLLKLDAENLRKSPTTLTALREKLFLLWGDLEERKANAQKAGGKSLKETNGNAQDRGKKWAIESKGRPLQCCLKEYGVKIKVDGETGKGLVNGGESELGEKTWRWERRWRMWGCTIIL